MFQADGTATFFNRTYDETMDLILEARDYLTGSEARDRKALGPVQRLSVSCETMRITSRLTQVMAWLLIRKAVHAGEMTEEQAADEQYRLAGQLVCNDIAAEEDEEMPSHLKSLLRRSYSLYTRVSRLDRMLEDSEYEQEGDRMPPAGITSLQDAAAARGNGMQGGG